tara:strand:- start:641 stop:1048 length:408 start_codon:yes stop_codon:yes gene_type:complete
VIAFEKVLSKNDTGESGSHQAGILVPKGNDELRSFFPTLDETEKNPDVMLDCQDEDGRWWRFRYVYYNNKHHDDAGTRDEYRITRMTSYLRNVAARSGQCLVFEEADDGAYRISLRHDTPKDLHVTRLSGWRRVH